MTDYIATDTELTSVANAIRTKGGTNAQLSWPTGYVDAVNAISTGGDKADQNDVVFIDYDGTILYSYSAADFAQLTAMPSNPSRTSEGLTAQGWNWSLSDAKTHVAKYGFLTIGQMYATTDGKTHIFLHINEEITSFNFDLYWRQSVANSCLIDWGDGQNAERYNYTGSCHLLHTYATGGDYEISIASDENTTLDFGGWTNGYSVYGYMSSNYPSRCVIQKIHLGSNVSELKDYAFQTCSSLKAVSIPSTLNISGSYVFYTCKNLKSVVVPTSTTSINTYFVSLCSNMKYIALPNNLTSVKAYAFNNADNIRMISLPDSITQHGTYFCNGVNALERINLPEGYAYLQSNALQGCYSLAKITVPSTVTYIYASVFNGCYSLKEVHMLPTSPPTLNNVNAFTNCPGPIYVPYSADHSIINAYKSASNWSTTSVANKIQEEPDPNA